MVETGATRGVVWWGGPFESMFEIRGSSGEAEVCGNMVDFMKTKVQEFEDCGFLGGEFLEEEKHVGVNPLRDGLFVLLASGNGIKESGNPVVPLQVGSELMIKG